MAATGIAAAAAYRITKTACHYSGHHQSHPCRPGIVPVVSSCCSNVLVLVVVVAAAAAAAVIRNPEPTSIASLGLSTTPTGGKPGPVRGSVPVSLGLVNELVGNKGIVRKHIYI